MADEFSFDVVSEVNLQEADNAVNQATKEVLQRYDFRGSKSQIVLDKTANKITLVSDDEYRMKSLIDIFESKLVKRGIAVNALKYGPLEQALGGTVRKTAEIQQGIPQEPAKEISRIIRDSGMKLRAQIQNEQIRVFGRKKDDLQSAIQLLKARDFGRPLQFTNYR